MKNPKSFSTFLEGFNFGTGLSLISLGGVLLHSPTIQLYSLILILILTIGVVVGVVRQYLLIQLTLMKNMSDSFKHSKNQVPTRLLEMRQYKLMDTLKFLSEISTRLRLNMFGVWTLTLLLLLTLCLPIIYTAHFSSKMIGFSWIWCSLVVLYALSLVRGINQTYYVLQHQINHLLELYQFNRAKVSE